MKDSAAFDFSKWSKWLKDLIRQEIYKANGILLVDIELSEGFHFVGLPKKADMDMAIRRNQRFLKAFDKVCRKFELSVDEPTSEAELLAHKLKRSIERTIKRYARGSQQRNAGSQRHKLPTPISMAIVYGIEVSKGNRESLDAILRFFNPRGELHNFIQGQLFRLKDTRDLETTPKIPPSIRKLTVARDSSSTMWANHWRYDLLRNIAAKTGAAIPKKVSQRQRKILINRILEFGHKSMIQS